MKSQLLWALLGVLWTLPSIAKSENWRQIESAHFRVIYSSSQKKLAEYYTIASERAFTELEPIFKENPSFPITVILVDRTDLANGSATFLPYALVVAYPVLPESGSSISDFENWAYELMLHELAHIYTFAPVHGFYKPFQWIFGNVVRPNGVLPRWYMEGLAVELESRYSMAGRLRSATMAATIRALTLSDRWNDETLERINESSIPVWPYGERPYLFGALMWHDLVEERGIDVIHRLNQRFSRRLPFLLNTPFYDEGGLDVSERWDRLRTRLSQEARTQIDRIQKAGPTPEKQFPEVDEIQTLPSISPDGLHLAYLANAPFKGASLRLWTRNDNKSEFSQGTKHSLFDVMGATNISWAPDSKSFIFDQTSLHISKNQRYTYRDLYRLSLSTPDKPERLTHQMRASEPALAPNGLDLVFIRNWGGRQDLAILNLKSKKIRTLISARLGLALARPVFRDDNTLYFVGRSTAGLDRIYRIDLKTNQRTPLKDFARRITSLQMTPEGLLVAAEVSGLHNIYLLKNDSDPRPLTNTNTEVLQATFDSWRGEIVYSQLTGAGDRLFSAPAKPLRVATVSQMPSLNYKAPANTQPVTFKKIEMRDEDYSAWPYMLPRYWVPFMYPVEKGVLFQGTSQAGDPTGRHNYGLNGTYDTVTKQAGYGVRYLNSVWPFTWSMMVSEYNELLGGQDLQLTSRNYGLDAAFNLPAVSNSWTGSLAATQTESELPSASGVRPIERLGATAQVAYSSAAAHARASNKGDQYYSLTHTSYISGGKRVAYERTAAQMGFSIRGPFPARHALSFQARGSYAPSLGLNNTVVLGDRTIGGNYLVSLVNSNMLLRGYYSGALVGRSLVTTNLDYRFPAGDLFRGNGTFPLFLRSLDMAVFVDNAMVDGAYYSPSQRSYRRSNFGSVFTGTGAEFILSGTAAYHLPVSLTLGLYYGLDTRPGGGFVPFISLGYVGHGGVDKGSSSSSTRSRPAFLAR